MDNNKILMTWVYQKNGKTYPFEDLIKRVEDRTEALVAIKIMENVENQIKTQLTEEEMSKLTLTLESHEDGTIKIRLSGDDTIVQKVKSHD